MANNPQKPTDTAKPAAPSSLDNFDRLMRGLVHVSKAELDAEIAKEKHPKKATEKKRN